MAHDAQFTHILTHARTHTTMDDEEEEERV
jgi:hypothetical protein